MSSNYIIKDRFVTLYYGYQVLPLSTILFRQRGMFFFHFILTKYAPSLVSVHCFVDRSLSFCRFFIIILSVFRFTASDYQLGIFKLFLY